MQASIYNIFAWYFKDFEWRRLLTRFTLWFLLAVNKGWVNITFSWEVTLCNLVDGYLHTKLQGITSQIITSLIPLWEPQIQQGQGQFLETVPIDSSFLWSLKFTLSGSLLGLLQHSDNHILIKWMTEADVFTFQNNLAYRNVISKYNYFKQLTFFILQLRVPSFEVYAHIRKSWH
jgi:hypothetical protein